MPNAVQNVALNKRKITSTQHDFKPLPFASVEARDLLLYFPAHLSEVIGIGFHESEKQEALTLRPVGGCYMRESTQTVSRSVSFSRFPILFVMYSRSRRQTPTSAADVGVKPCTTIRSPVDGVVSKIQTYYLYSRYIDFRVEIQPNNHSELRVAIIHLDNTYVKVGDKVYSGKTELGKVRKLSENFDSQINEYLPENCDHIHIQVNKYVPEQDKNQPKIMVP